MRGAIVTAFGAPPIDGLGTTGGFKMIIEDRGNLGLDDLQQVSDAIVERRQRGRRGLEGLFNSSRANTPWLYLDIDRDQVHGPGRARSATSSTRLQVYLGSYYVNNFNEFGRTWQVNVQADQQLPRPSRRTSASSRCGTTSGQMIRAGARCWTCATPAGR